MIFAGQLDRRITIQQQVITRDAMGAPVEGFSSQYKNVPAAIKPLSGREKFHVESQREMTYRQYKFTIRYILGLTERHRIVWDGYNWDILYMAELGRREGWEILAQIAK